MFVTKSQITFNSCFVLVKNFSKSLGNKDTGSTVNNTIEIIIGDPYNKVVEPILVTNINSFSVVVFICDDPTVTEAIDKDIGVFTTILDTKSSTNAF